MKKKKIKIVLLLCIFLLLLVPILYSHVCMYVCEGEWTGRLHHCYSVTISSGVVSYTRNFCTYHGAYPSSGTREYDRDLVDRC